MKLADLRNYRPVSLLPVVCKIFSTNRIQRTADDSKRVKRQVNESDKVKPTIHSPISKVQGKEIPNTQNNGFNRLFEIIKHH